MLQGTDNRDTVLREKAQQGMLQAYLQNTPLGMLGFAVTQYLTSIASYSVEVFFRRQFGERYFNAAAFWPSVALYWLIYSFFGGASPYMLPFGVAYTLMGFAHLIYIFWRSRMKEQLWHSYAVGISWLTPITGVIRHYTWRNCPFPNNTQRFVEPLIVLAFAYALQPVDLWLGAWLAAAGMSLSAKEFIRATLQRNAELNQIDAYIEGMVTQIRQERMQEAGDDQPERLTARESMGATTVLPDTARTRAMREAIMRGSEGFADFQRRRQENPGGATD